MSKILIFTGFSGFTQRLDNVAALIQKTYGCEIDCLVFGRENHDYLTRTPKARYGRVVCVEEILENCPNIEICHEELVSIEAELGCSLTHLAYAERYFVQHTHNLPAARRLDQDEIVSHVVNLHRTITDLLVDVDIAISYTCASIESELLYYAARARAILFLTFNEQRIGYGWSVLENNLDIHEEALRLYRDPTFVATDAGRIRFESYRNRLLRNQKNRVETLYQLKRVADKRLNGRNLARFLKNFVRPPNAHYLAPTRSQRFARNVRFKVREQYVRRLLGTDLPDRPFVYFPLALIPEASTLIRGLKHYDQLSLIKQVSLTLPLDWVLLVRDHPSMVGATPISFYREVSDIFNVQLVSPVVSPIDSIRRSEAVITVTGTSGIEALALGKKTITLGTSIYSGLNSVFLVEDVMEIGSILRRPWKKSDVTGQIDDVVQFASALESSPAFDDPEGTLWTRAAFDPSLSTVDTNMFEALRAPIARRLGDGVLGHVRRGAAN